MEGTISGQEISELRTMSSYYDDGHIIMALVGNEWCRMSLKEVIKFINDVTFRAVKKRKHTHLVVEHTHEEG